MSDADLTRRLEFARTAAVEAGALTLRYFRSQVRVERKSDNSPVTIADRGAEQLLRDRIAAAFPQDGVLGEEFGETPGSSGYRWLLDPIDGTKSFISGVPLYGVMVAVERDRRAAAGVIYIPGLDEGAYAAEGGGAWTWRGSGAPERCRVADCPRLADGLFVTSQVDTFAQRGARGAYDELEGRAYVTRTWGDCYGYLLVATGRAALMVDPILNVWDAAAVAPLITEAGGRFVDWRGEPSIYSGDALAAPPLIAEEALAITRRYPRPA